MKFLKKFESFATEQAKAEIEDNIYFDKIVSLLDDNAELLKDFNEIVEKLKSADSKLIEPIFYQTEVSSKLLAKETETFRFEGIEHIDTQKMAREALKYLAVIGVISLLVKLFYKVGTYIFTNLDDMGIPAVAGGVLLVLLYLAFAKAKPKTSMPAKVEKNPKSGDEYIDFSEM